MITLAMDTATDRCSVAIDANGMVAVRDLDGSRRHASAILGMIDETLHEVHVTAASINRVIVADGPGSFTGLRVAAAVAKALAWRRDISWCVASSLLVRAMAHRPANGGRVLALSDALRGEVYAGCWDFSADQVHRFGPVPRAMRIDDLVAFQPVDIVVGTLAPALVDSVSIMLNHAVITGVAALPDARDLLKLANLVGGTVVVNDPASWQPEYGRPVEAQAAWERSHGVELSVARGHAG